MKPQEIQIIIKMARKLVGYAGLDEHSGIEGANAKTTYLAPKLGVVSDEQKVEIWLRRDPNSSSSDGNRVFYALNLDGDNYMVMIYHVGRWVKYLQIVLQEREKRGFGPVDDADLFPEVEVVDMKELEEKQKAAEKK